MRTHIFTSNLERGVEHSVDARVVRVVKFSSITNVTLHMRTRIYEYAVVCGHIHTDTSNLAVCEHKDALVICIHC